MANRAIDATDKRHRRRVARELEREIWEAEQRRIAHLAAAKELTRAKVAARLGLARRTLAKVLRRIERERAREAR